MTTRGRWALARRAAAAATLESLAAGVTNLARARRSRLAASREQPGDVPLEVEAQQPLGDRGSLARRLAVPGADARFVIEQVDRTLDEGRSRHAVAGGGEGFLHRGREIADAADPFHQLDVGRDDGALVDVLQRAAALQRGGGGAAERTTGDWASSRVLERGQRIGDAGTRGDRGHAGQRR